MKPILEPERSAKKPIVRPIQAHAMETAETYVPPSVSPVGVSPRSIGAQPPLTRDTILSLQRTVGNRAVHRILQAKLRVGTAQDRYEREAETMAQQVVEHMPVALNERSGIEPGVRPRTAPESVISSARPMLSSHFDGGAAPIALADEATIHQVTTNGQVLDAGVRHPMELLFRSDFKDVRVHTDATSDQLNRSLNANAFTTGDNIFFRAGEYDPGSRRSQKLLAHELTHVVQQRGLRAGLPPITQGVIQRSGSSSASTDTPIASGNNYPTYPCISVTTDKFEGWGDHTRIWIALVNTANGTSQYIVTDLIYGDDSQAGPIEGSSYNIARRDPTQHAGNMNATMKGVTIRITPASPWHDGSKPNQTWQISLQNAQAALRKARQLESDKDKYWYSPLGFGWRGMSCATYAEKILRAAGVHRTAGLLIKTPSELVTGRKGGLKGFEEKDPYED